MLTALTSRKSIVGLLISGALALGGSAGAQSPVPGALVPIPTRTYIGFNPLGLPVDIGTLEVESGIAPGVTIGGVASYVELYEKPFRTFDLKLRYYPGEVVLRGISVGATAGYTRYSKVVSGTRHELRTATAGIILDRNWLFGRAEHFLVGTGIGAKRLIAGSAERSAVDLPGMLLTIRLITGFAF